MTGNKNAWRAPLAGLASLAMIATMGVTALSANAAMPDVKATLNANGGQVDGVATKLYDDSTAGDGANDGKLAWLYDTAHFNVTAPAGKVFTGWYEADSKQAVGPDTELEGDVTLTAHYASADNDKYEVVFENADKYTTGWTSASQIITTNGNDKVVKLAPGDQLASWQYSITSAGTGLFAGWTNKGVAVTDFATVQPGDSLRPDYAEHVKTYTFTPAGSVDDVQWSEGATAVTTTSVKVAADAEAPTVYYTDGNGPQQISKWKTTDNVNYTPDGNATEVYKADVFAYDGTTSLTYAGYTAVYFAKSDVDLAKGFDLSALKGFETVKEKDEQFAGWYAQYDTISGKFAKPLEYVSNYDFYETYGNNREGNAYAKFEAAADSIKVTYDPNYAGSEKATVSLSDGAYLGDTLPAPTRDGYTFRGWYANKNNGGSVLDVQVSKDTKVAFTTGTASVTKKKVETANGKVTFYAKWESTLYAELNDLLNLKNTRVNEGLNAIFGARMYTDASWAKYKAAREAVLDKSGVTPDSDGKYAVSDEDMSEAEAKAYVDTLSAAKAALVVVPELAGAYTDVDALTPHYTDILSLTAQGVIKGYADGTFRGMNQIKRQDFAAFMYRLAGEPAFDEAKATKTFTDVTAGDEANHSKAVLWAASNGIIGGFADGTFRGLDNIKRQDAAAMLYRLAGSPTFKATTSSFSDVTAGDEANHATAVLWAASKGIVRGYADGTFRGMKNIVRQDAAAFLNRTTVAKYLQ